MTRPKDIQKLLELNQLGIILNLHNNIRIKEYFEAINNTQSNLSINLKRIFGFIALQ